MYNFFILRFPFTDDCVLASELEKYIWSSIGLFLLVETFLNLEIPVLCLFLIQRMRFFILKIVFLRFVFV